VALLDDKDWLWAEYAGDQYKAADGLGMEFLHDINCTFSVWDLLQIYRKFPDEKTWKDKKYQLDLLFEASRPRMAAECIGSRPLIKVKEHRAVKEQLEEKKQEVINIRKMLKSKDQIIAELTAEVERLKAENAKLSGRLHKLENRRREFSDV
jgi:predicted RNase H-like nuclease (RuvC/YqgF family)